MGWRTDDLSLIFIRPKPTPTTPAPTTKPSETAKRLARAVERVEGLRRLEALESEAKATKVKLDMLRREIKELRAKWWGDV